MSKIKSKEAFKERDEIEEYFREVKNRSFPIGIIPIFLLILLLGGISYYYFIIDNPKTIFLETINNVLNKIEHNYSKQDKINFQIDLDSNIETTNKKYLDIANIINDVALSIEGGIDLNTSKIYTNINSYYKQEDLLLLNAYYKSDKNIYLKSDKIFDKVVKISSNKQSDNKNNTNYNINKYNLETLYNSLVTILKPILKESEYQKEYIILEDKLVKKITLNVDKSLKEKIYNNILENDEFIHSLSKVSCVNKEKIEKTINKKLDNLNNKVDTISLYVDIIENNFITLEINTNKDRILLTKENNKYIYKIYHDEIIEYQGTVEFTKTNKDYEIKFNLEDISKDLNININLDLTIDYHKDIESIDIENAINYKDLSEIDINKITKNINNNKNLTNLIQDIKEISNKK